MVCIIFWLFADLVLVRSRYHDGLSDGAVWPISDSDVAILFPRSSWLWDNSTQMTGSCTTDKKGDPDCAKLGADCVATIDLYCSTEAGGPPTMCSDCLAAWPAKLSQANCPKDATGAFDAVLLSYCEGLGPAGPFSNEDQGSASMDCKSFVPTRCVRARM